MITKEDREDCKEIGKEFAHDMDNARVIAQEVFGEIGRAAVLGVWRRIVNKDNEEQAEVIEGLKKARLMAIDSEKLLTGSETPAPDLVFEAYDEAEATA